MFEKRKAIDTSLKPRKRMNQAEKGRGGAPTSVAATTKENSIEEDACPVSFGEPKKLPVTILSGFLVCSAANLP